MDRYSKTSNDIQPISGLPLFDWRPTVPYSQIIVLKLARRFGLSIAHAATVAHLAGIGSEGGR